LIFLIKRDRMHPSPPLVTAKAKLDRLQATLSKLRLHKTPRQGKHKGLVLQKGLSWVAAGEEGRRNK